MKTINLSKKQPPLYKVENAQNIKLLKKLKKPQIKETPKQIKLPQPCQKTDSISPKL
jgi:hypothetical protein